MESLFEGTYGAPCPESFRDALALPDHVELRWRRDGVAGEFKIGNPLMVSERRLDESVLDLTLDGILLRDTRILDYVADYASPHTVLFKVQSGTIEPTLYLFDFEELRTLEFTYDLYLEWAAVSRGIVFWQFLFCDDRIRSDIAEVLDKGIDLLRRVAPDPGLDELAERLDKRRK